MANTKRIASIEQVLGSHGVGFLRRSVLKLVSRVLLIAMLPVSPLPDPALADLDDTKIEQAETRRQSVVWTAAMERDFERRWDDFQSREDIAREMGISLGMVRVHATRLGLAARTKDQIRSA